jgi:hypothetical protein
MMNEDITRIVGKAIALGSTQNPPLRMDEDIARIVGKVTALGLTLDSPLSEEVVSAFEAAHGVRLPEAYRRFLTQASNGGPGLLPLDVSMHLKDLAVPSNIVPELGNDLGSLPDQHDYRGTLALADEGCGYLSLLIVSGPSRGRIASVGGRDLHFWESHDFLDWYETWLDYMLRQGNDSRQTGPAPL